MKLARNLRQNGFTLLEILVVIAVIGILIGMMLPAVRRTGGAARRTECSNRIRQITLSIHNYVDVHKCIPPAMGTFDQQGRAMEENDGHISAYAALLPFLEHNSILDQLTTECEYNGVKYPPMGAAVLDPNYRPWNIKISEFRCPQEPRRQDFDFGKTNFAFSIGDAARDLYKPNPPRGAFSTRVKSKLEEISDGTSNTIMMTEICSSPEEPTRSQVVNFSGDDFLDNRSQIQDLYNQAKTGFKDSVSFTPHRRGKSWADGIASSTLVNTIIPPNGISCAENSRRNANGFFTASGNHDGGINATFADGSTHFFLSSMETGDPEAACLTSEQLQNPAGIPSPHGLWGSLGSANDNQNDEESWNN